MNAKRLLSSALLLVGLLAVTACGKAEIGEECDKTGSTDECVEGGICDTLGGDTTGLQCLKICTQDSDCPATQACTGVSGSNQKACHNK
ncbi:hypothetical protein JQX13_18505 [Archangium violaceum]|uniref:hypothetical protein n=1 Tax=Archangium violaceum TaxID=83451 RepID=UPI00193B9E6D|nr:hypothetical protein [Archangium violaceum]QRK11868.1 hypothetical protein JQX13_18505 [Archangium violaceum]